MPESTSEKFRNLGFGDWPFRLVPAAGPTGIWYDRSDLKRDLDRLMWRLARHDSSTLHLLWADVGSGKTHTLRFLEHEALAGGEILPVYAVMPRVSRSFLELHAAVSRSLDLSIAADALFALRNAEGARAAERVIVEWPDLLPALTLYHSGNHVDRELVRRWLAGSRDLTRSDLRRVGIAQEIRTSDHAVSALTATSRLYLTVRRRLLVLIDELQRIGTVRSTVANEISAGIHTWFNAVPDGLSVVLTFSFGDKSHVDALLTPELLSRSDHQRLEMTVLTRDDARDFVRAAVAACRLPDTEATALGEDLIGAGVEALAAKGSLTPRNMMKGFNALLLEIDYRQGTGESVLTPPEARALIGRLSLDAEDEDG